MLIASSEETKALADSQRTLILYSYFETQLALPNLEYFVAVGIPYYINQTDVDIVIILNSPQVSQWVRIPFATNVYVIQRDNIGMDLCAYRSAFDNWHMIPGILQRYGITTDALTGVRSQAWHQIYRRVILINASVRGPFAPNYIGEDWIPLLTTPLSSRVKLVGSTINCHLMDKHTGHFPDLHIQSMILAFTTDIHTLIYSQLACCHSKWDTIFKGEVSLTRHMIRDHGYNIAVTSIFWRDFDFTNQWAVAGRCDYLRRHTFDGNGDHNFEFGNLGTTPTPVELVFIKTNRGIDPIRLMVWTDAATRVAAKRWRVTPIIDHDVVPHLTLSPLVIPGRCLDLEHITVLEDPDASSDDSDGSDANERQT